jgi:hypothetical protein
MLTDPPTLDDMRPYQALRMHPRRNDPECLRLLVGISLYNTEAQARKKALGLPWSGKAFIAELQIPADAPFVIERTTDSPGHHTLWGEPHAILHYVSRVSPVLTKGVQQ